MCIDDGAYTNDGFANVIHVEDWGIGVETHGVELVGILCDELSKGVCEYGVF